tara:strand:+ start:18675 stop:19106 length:432 start_codon:yes stop_codon:yes gene_type:complete
MIAEIRKHIKDSIFSCSKLYKQIDNPFHKDEDTIGADPDYKYALVFGASNKIIDDEDGSVTEVPVNLKTYRQGNRDKLASFDEGYEQALIIKDLILDRSLINSKEYIKGMSSSTVIPGEVIDSQDIYSYEINFIFTISYGIGE